MNKTFTSLVMRHILLDKEISSIYRILTLQNQYLSDNEMKEVKKFKTLSLKN